MLGLTTRNYAPAVREFAECSHVQFVCSVYGSAYHHFANGLLATVQ